MKPMSEVQQIQLCIDHHAEEHSSMILVGVYWEIPIFQISQRVQSSLQVHLCKKYLIFLRILEIHSCIVLMFVFVAFLKVLNRRRNSLQLRERVANSYFKLVLDHFADGCCCIVQDNAIQQGGIIRHANHDLVKWKYFLLACLEQYQLESDMQLYT